MKDSIKSFQKYQGFLHKGHSFTCYFTIGFFDIPVIQASPHLVWRGATFLDEKRKKEVAGFLESFFDKYCSSNQRNIKKLYETSNHLFWSLLNYAFYNNQNTILKKIWAASYTSSFFQNELLTQLASLHSLYKNNLKLAIKYKKKINSTALYYQLFCCYYDLISQCSCNYQTQVQEGEERIATLRLEELYLEWTHTCFNGNKRREKIYLAMMLDLIDSNDESSIINMYMMLLHRGHLFLAQRFLLRQSQESSTFLAIVLYTYLTNHKFWSFILRLKKSQLWPQGRETWYMLCYAIYALGLEYYMRNILRTILMNKKKIYIPSETQMLSYIEKINILKIQAPQENIASIMDKPSLLNTIYCILPKEKRLSFVSQTFQTLFLTKHIDAKDQRTDVFYSFAGHLNFHIFSDLEYFMNQNNWTLLESIAGPLLPIRIIFALYYIQICDFVLAYTIISHFSWEHPIFYGMQYHLATKIGDKRMQKQSLQSLEKSLA